MRGHDVSPGPAVRYWKWVKATQDQYTFGFRPPLSVLASLTVLMACVTIPVALLVGLAAGAKAAGVETGLGVALLAAISLSVYAKHSARRGREDRWEPSK